MAMDSDQTDDTNYNQIAFYSVLALLLSFIVYKCPNIWRGYQNFLDERSTEEQNDTDADEFPKYTACKSPECVRCRKYQDIRQQAKDRLYQYLKNHDPKQLTRIILAVRGPKVSPRKFTLQSPNVFFLPGLSAKPWWDESRNLFEDDLKLLTQHYNEILTEFEDVLKLQDTSECSTYWSQNDTENGQWNVFCFYNQGCKIEQNCRKCPKTAGVLQKLPHLMKTCVFGNAFFSVLHPGTTVTEHYGPCNLRIRCHLGLKVPNECTMTVAEQSKIWKEGECILFDDSFLHSAKNGGSKETRVVLLLDFWHPYLTKPEKSAVEYLF